MNFNNILNNLVKSRRRIIKMKSLESQKNRKSYKAVINKNGIFLSFIDLLVLEALVLECVRKFLSDDYADK